MGNENPKCQQMQEIQGKIDLLRRNLEQMTPEQCTFYKKNLQALKVQIVNGAVGILREIVFGGLWMLENNINEEAQIVARAEKLMGTDLWKKQMRNAIRIMFREYSLQKFLEASVPLRTEIWFKAYGPYWVTKTVTDPETGKMENGILNKIWRKRFFWSSEHGQWESADGQAVTIALPPTMELLKQLYEEVSLHGGRPEKQNGGQR